MTRSERRMRRLHRLVQRLHAPRHRRRHGAATEALLDELLRNATDDVARNRLLRRAVRDALGTLWRSWRDALGRLVRPVRFRTTGAWDSLRSDLGFAMRFHRRRPIYLLVTVVTLALAVGANTAIYSVAEAALFRTLPYRNPDRIVELPGYPRGLYVMGPGIEWSATEKLATAPGIEAAGLYVTGGGANLVAGSAARRLTLTPVTDNFFDIMGVDLALGAGFSGALDSDVAVIAHNLWTQAFGADPSVLGRTLRLSGIPYRIVGVAPPEVRFPGQTEVWIRQPLHTQFFSDAAGPTLIARLSPGTHRPQVEALLAARTEEDRADGDQPPVLVPLRESLTESVRAPLFVLMGAAAMVFLLGCLNLAGVAVSRFLQRTGELHIRRALGAGRARVFRQLVVEALVLGVLAGIAGLAVAALGVRLLLAWLPGDVPGLSTAGVGTTSTLLAALLATLAALVINVPPALHVVRRARVGPTARTATEGRHQARLRSGLAVAQVAVALLLLIAAGLLGRSLIGVARTPLGIDVESVLTFEVHLMQPPRREEEDTEQFIARLRAMRNPYVDQVRSRIEEIPGVVAVGAVSQLPLTHEMGSGSSIRTPGTTEDAAVPVRFLEATPGYFDAIGTRFIRGTTFAAPGGAGHEIVISSQTARALFGTVDAAGLEALFRFPVDGWAPATIAGVVEDVHLRGPERGTRPTVYGLLRDSWDTRLGFAVRMGGDPRGIAERVAAAVTEVAPAVPPFRLQTTRQALSRELAARQALATVSSLFAATAMLLAAIGIYGLIAEAVARRRREIGIRIALGARSSTLVGSVAARGLALAALGTLIALPLMLWVGRLLEDVLYQVSPRDPWVLVAAPAVLLITAAVAAWAPARRAARVNPVEVLSAE